MTKRIDQFMWGYQEHFRESLESFANRAIEHAGVQGEAVALLVGVQEPGGTSHAVCIEPENGPWSVALFGNLENRIEKLVLEDPRQTMRYGDEPSNRDNPIWMRQTAIRKVVGERLSEFDKENRVRSFIGKATAVDGYRVVPVLQIPVRAIECQPALRKTHVSFLDTLVQVILDEAVAQMLSPEPGRSMLAFDRELDDVLRQAGRRLMYAPERAASVRAHGGLFESCNRVSALRYEGSVGVGRMILAARGHDCVHVDLEFAQPVPLAEANWARKILQMGSQKVALLSDGLSVYGLGRLCDAYDAEREDAFCIDFVGHYTWELIHESTVLMRTTYNVPRLPASRLAESEVKSLLLRIFPKATPTDTERISALVRVAIEQPHGTLIVVSDGAAGEASRLAAQATPITPTILSETMVGRVTGIDGAVLVDPCGTCYAIGVILDGPAIADGDPARGARFNSAKRYVASAGPKTMAVVVSEDGHVNMLPELRPQIHRSEVAEHVANFHELACDVESDWHKQRNWLNAHRFYLNADQCRQVNADLEKLRAEVMKDAGRLWIHVETMDPNQEMNDSYFFGEV